MTETTQHDDAKAASDFTRQTRMRRIFFGVTALGVGAIAVLGALFLFGGQLQTSEKAEAGKSRDVLRHRFVAFRPKCQGLWRAIEAIDFARVPKETAKILAAKLQEELSCQEVADLARGLPQRPGGGLPPAASQPETGPRPIIRLGPGIRLGPQLPASGPAPAPAPASAK